MEPTNLGYRALDAIVGRLMWRRWIDAAVDSLEQTIARRP